MTCDEFRDAAETKLIPHDDRVNFQLAGLIAHFVSCPECEDWLRGRVKELERKAEGDEEAMAELESSKQSGKAQAKQYLTNGWFMQRARQALHEERSEND